MKKILKYLLIVLAILGVLFFGLKKNINLEKMNVHETDHFTVYYEVLGQKAIHDIYETLEKNYLVAQEFFDLGQQQKGKIVIYGSVARFQQAYLGFFLSLFYDEWAAGAANQDMVLITSPENPGTQHTYAEILEIIMHEYVHTLVYQQNEMPNIWLDEGVAVFLAGQKSEFSDGIPEYGALQSEDLNTFLENDGYAYSYVYIEYLINLYDKEKIVKLIKTNNYEESLGVSALEVYDGWVEYLETEYSLIKQ